MTTENTTPIQSEEEYEAALKRIDEIFEAEPETPEGDEIEILIKKISDYEDIHYPIGEPDSEE